MKLNRKKFQLGTKIKFGGVTIEDTKQKGDKEKRVYISPAEDKLKEFFDIPTPSCCTDIQRICGMAAQQTGGQLNISLLRLLYSCKYFEMFSLIFS